MTNHGVVTMTYRIVLADDQPLVRECIKRILADGKDLEVVAEADDGLELLALLADPAMTPDLVIVDITMPHLEGIEAIRRIKQTRPDIKALILTVHKGEDYVARALSVGASGYLIKEDADFELMPAIGKIRRGETYISSCLAQEGN